jgi:hypothetical protein
MGNFTGAETVESLLVCACEPSHAFPVDYLVWIYHEKSRLNEQTVAQEFPILPSAEVGSFASSCSKFCISGDSSGEPEVAAPPDSPHSYPTDTTLEIMGILINADSRVPWQPATNHQLVAARHGGRRQHQIDRPTWCAIPVTVYPQLTARPSRLLIPPHAAVSTLVAVETITLAP